ncbi:hypothetical protein M23134_01904 [Microscilla marina ATCC 23134]|uniref:Peptidase C39-like domain-containing protein n=2 Tax=Microscilla marina TaxID=1027 RepID=A1ZC73_MICM2|nr:hypothetical protein M23134_01904 [Microscilla marina ATCC 23134]
MAQKIYYCLSFFIFIHITANAQELYYEGVSSKKMNYTASVQNNTQWCWAASIQMVLKYYGVYVTQEQIVQRSFGVKRNGQLPNLTASPELITANLNKWGVDNRGQRYRVQATWGRNAPHPDMLLKEMRAKYPVIIGYEGENGGHAVVITAVGILDTQQGPAIEEIVVRDPWPSRRNRRRKGRVVYPGEDLANRIGDYWFIRVQKY